ncbi:DUF2569 family protein [Lysobacter sp. K5869]|uniref:DUF2569 family protein n=1 Tax=Lysobacter sp. K5869 TaxID=2820808 RepID=UPI001C05F255|nr:DUF2569 family protein [Lysobacter sp. K5869]QWP77628.1 DUF2569 family protein [Lysobacter sp. K5869]
MDKVDPYRRLPASGGTPADPAFAQAGSGLPRPRPQGLGGWLAVFAVVLLAWLAVSAATFTLILAMIGSSHAPTGAAMIRAQCLLVAIAVLFAAKLTVLALMWLRSPRFPRALVAWLVANIVVAATFWMSLAFERPEDMLYVAPLLATELLWNGGWIAYALKSERIRNTFSARER